MSIRRTASLIIVGVLLGVLLVACAELERPVGDVPNCRREIRGVTGVIRPETSKLSCAVIDELTFGLPAEPQAYLIGGESPGMNWKCRYYSPAAKSVLLRCSYRQKHFSIVKEASLDRPKGT